MQTIDLLAVALVLLSTAVAAAAQVPAPTWRGRRPMRDSSRSCRPPATWHGLAMDCGGWHVDGAHEHHASRPGLGAGRSDQARRGRRDRQLPAAWQQPEWRCRRNIRASPTATASVEVAFRQPAPRLTLDRLLPSSRLEHQGGRSAGRTAGRQPGHSRYRLLPGRQGPSREADDADGRPGRRESGRDRLGRGRHRRHAVPGLDRQPRRGLRVGRRADDDPGRFRGRAAGAGTGAGRGARCTLAVAGAAARDDSRHAGGLRRCSRLRRRRALCRAPDGGRRPRQDHRGRAGRRRSRCLPMRRSSPAPGRRSSPDCGTPTCMSATTTPARSSCRWASRRCAIRATWLR